MPACGWKSASDAQCWKWRAAIHELAGDHGRRCSARAGQVSPMLSSWLHKIALSGCIVAAISISGGGGEGGGSRRESPERWCK
jgi:hypothetical protein